MSRAFFHAALVLGSSLLGLQALAASNTQGPRLVEQNAFNQGWYFRLGEYDVVKAGYAGGDWESKGGWDLISLPHSYNVANTFTNLRGYYRGIGWYRKHFTLDEAQAQKAVFLHFGAAYSVAEIWVNEVPMGRFMGGFTPIEIDVTHAVHTGDNLVAVKVSNAHDPDVLPGKDIPDYCLYGGLYREAALVLKDKLHIESQGLKVVASEVSESAARARVLVHVKNRHAERKNGMCVVELLDGDKSLATLERSFTLEAGKEIALELGPIALVQPRLWSLETPALHRAVAHLHDTGSATQQDALVADIAGMPAKMERGPEVDQDAISFGLRHFEFTPDRGFLLNGKSVKLLGINRHQDYPGLANAMPAWMQVRDAELLKAAGGNFVRTSHYPQHPAFLDACDRLGILVYEEICSWQYVGGPAFERNAEAMMRAMIKRDIHHPSIVLWGLFNEGRSQSLFEKLHRMAKQMDPSRPTVYAENSPDEALKLGAALVPDVLGLNYSTEKLAEIRAMLPGKPLFSSEYAAVSGGTRQDLEKQLEQIEGIKKQLDQIEAQPFMAGHTLWSMHDYSTDYWGGWPIHHSGVLDAWRLPKEGWYFMQSRWQTKPVLHVCGHWTWPGAEGQSKPVWVLSNCDSVELFLNGRSLGLRTGENPARWEVPYESGELRAVGNRNGERLEESLRTAGAPAALLLETSHPSITTGNVDAAELTVRLVDAAGIIVPLNGDKVCFHLDGPGMLRGVGGQPECLLEAGMARIVLQALSESGTVAVHAACGQLEANLRVEVRPNP